MITIVPSDFGTGVFWTIAAGLLALAASLLPAGRFGDAVALAAFPLMLVVCAGMLSLDEAPPILRLGAFVSFLLYAAVAAASRTEVQASAVGTLETHVEHLPRATDFDRRRVRLRSLVVAMLALFATFATVTPMLAKSGTAASVFGATMGAAIGLTSVVVYGGPATRRRRGPMRVRRSRLWLYLGVLPLGAFVYLLLDVR
ncbi:MAG: hypothetical protein AAF411_22430 [Myxococcota bacterium]